MCFSWNLQDPRLRTQPSQERKGAESDVFKTIDRLMRGKFDAAKASEKETRQRLLGLTKVSSEFDLSLLEEAERCPICPEEVLLTSPREVWYHVHSSTHKAKLDLNRGEAAVIH